MRLIRRSYKNGWTTWSPRATYLGTSVIYIWTDRMFSVCVSHGCKCQSWLSCRFAISYSFTRSHLHDSLYTSTSFSQGIFTGEFLKCSCVYSQKKNPLIINTESVYLSPSDSLTCDTSCTVASFLHSIASLG